MAAKFTQEAMTARLAEVQAEAKKHRAKLEPMMAELDKASNAARKLRDRVIQAKAPLVEAETEIGMLSRALGARSMVAEAKRPGE